MFYAIQNYRRQTQPQVSEIQFLQHSSVNQSTDDPMLKTGYFQILKAIWSCAVRKMCVLFNSQGTPFTTSLSSNIFYVLLGEVKCILLNHIFTQCFSFCPDMFCMIQSHRFSFFVICALLRSGVHFSTFSHLHTDLGLAQRSVL